MPRKQDDFVMLKLKEKERKKRKNEEKFNQKVSENTDKLKEVTIKTAKIEKMIAIYSDILTVCHGVPPPAPG